MLQNFPEIFFSFNMDKFNIILKIYLLLINLKNLKLLFNNFKINDKIQLKKGKINANKS